MSDLVIQRHERTAREQREDEERRHMETAFVQQHGGIDSIMYPLALLTPAGVEHFATDANEWLSKTEWAGRFEFTTYQPSGGLLIRRTVRETDS